MSATITTQPQRRLPFVTALAIASVVVAGGALGVAWEQSRDSAAPAETPALTPPTAQDYSKYNYYHGPNAVFGEQGNKGQTSKVPNAQVAEQHLDSTFQPPSGGRVQLGL
jgi:hypothetical protein